jgi:transcription initiation protein SPT3
VQARALAARRGSRYLSTEDLIFLIRHDRAKVTRLRTYLSWKDVRKKAKDTEGGNDGADIEDIGNAEETAAAAAAAASSSSSSKAVPVAGHGGGRMRIKIPWEITNIFSEYLPENSDDEDEDEKEAYEDSKKRLKVRPPHSLFFCFDTVRNLNNLGFAISQDADDLTRTMSKDEYTQYSEARQASFTYRKGATALVRQSIQS